MLIPHKVKNKGKYISFHYLRGWKARKIRKVQEISPQILICKELYGKHIKLIDFIDTYEKADDCRIKEMNKWLLANGIITCMFMNTTNTKTEYALMCIIILIYMILFIRYNNDRIGGVNCAIAVIFEFIIVLSVLYEWNLITCAIFGYYYLWMIKIRKNM